MNISQRGLFLRPGALNPRESLRLSSSLNADRPLFFVVRFRGEKATTRARSSVAWKSDTGIGLHFDDPPERLRDFVSDLHDEGTQADILSQVESCHIEID